MKCGTIYLCTSIIGNVPIFHFASHNRRVYFFRFIFVDLNRTPKKKREATTPMLKKAHHWFIIHLLMDTDTIYLQYKPKDRLQHIGALVIFFLHVIQHFDRNAKFSVIVAVMETKIRSTFKALTWIWFMQKQISGRKNFSEFVFFFRSHRELMIFQMHRVWAI